jgi:hypothetical protein
MRLPRIRFTMRIMILMVAMVAVAMTTAWPALERRSTACRIAANRHWKMAALQLKQAVSCEKGGLKQQADYARLCEAMHRDQARQMTWAFLDPTRACILNDDLY